MATLRNETPRLIGVWGLAPIGARGCFDVRLRRVRAPSHDGAADKIGPVT